jgi:methyl-accepting chemotaxis protein
VKRVGDIISEIAASSSEQSVGIEQVDQALRKMDALTQQNAALAEETFSASASQSEQVGQMGQLIQYFRLRNA